MSIDSGRGEGTPMYGCLEWIMVPVFRGQCVNTDQNKILYEVWPNDPISRILFPEYPLKFSYQNICKSIGHNNKKHKPKTYQMPNDREMLKQSEDLHTIENYVAILSILGDYLMMKKRIHNIVKCEK